MNEILMELYAQELARMTHRALTAEATVLELQTKLAEAEKGSEETDQ